MYFTVLSFKFSKSEKSALVTFLNLDQSGIQLPHMGRDYSLDSGIQEEFRMFYLLLLFQYTLLICLGKGQTVPIFLGTHWASFLTTHKYQFWENSFNYCLYNYFLPFPVLSLSKISVIQIIYLWSWSSNLFFCFSISQFCFLGSLFFNTFGCITILFCQHTFNSEKLFVPCVTIFNCICSYLVI